MSMGNHDATTSADELLEQIWPQEGLETVHRCPVCGALDRTLFYSLLLLQHRTWIPCSRE